MTICLFKTIGFLLMALAFLLLGVAQSVSFSTTYTTTTIFKTVTVSDASSTQSDTAGLLPVTGAGKILTNDLLDSSPSNSTMPDVQTDSTCTSAGIVFDCQATPTGAYSAQVTTMANGATVTPTSVVPSTISPSDAVVVDTTTTSTSTFLAPTTVLATQYVLSKSSASATYGNQYAALLLSGNGGEKISVASQAIVAVVSLMFVHVIAMAFF